MRYVRLLSSVVVVLGVLAVAAPAPSQAAVSIGVSVGFAPPPLPVYDQPPLPGPGYVWMPGYWAYGPSGYYWVPGTWVLPPGVGLYWTPPWWGWNGSVYAFHGGYWGPSVGFYGGINYGFGYGGVGYDGGRWDHGRFFYNRDVNNFGSVHVANVYSKPLEPGPQHHVGFTGGVGGVAASPNAQEQAAGRGRHVFATAPQTQHFNTARGMTSLRSTQNNGQPPIMATNRAGRFNSSGVVAQRGGQPGKPKGR